MIDIVTGDLGNARVIDLLEGHVARCRQESPRESAHAFEPNDFRRAEVSLWAAWAGDRLLGVAALMQLSSDHGEVKSMHTAEAERGRGVATALLRHILAVAADPGYRRLSLETGSMDYFGPARALYARHGFAECDPFEGYVPDPNSVFMTRRIARQAEPSASSA